MSSPILAPFGAMAAAAVCGLALSLPLLRLFIPRPAFGALLFVPLVSGRARDDCVRIEGSRHCRKQFGPRGLQFLMVRTRELLEQLFSATGEGQHYFAAVRRAARASQQAFHFQAIH